MKTLVAFYSLTGKTRLVAQTIARELKADLVEIEEAKPRKSGPSAFISAGMSARQGKASEIKPISLNLDDYGAIFIGSPVWGSRPAPAVNAFVDSASLKERELVLFFTMGGTGGEAAARALAERAKKRDGKVIGSFSVASGKASEEEITAEAKRALAPYKR